MKSLNKLILPAIMAIFSLSVLGFTQVSAATDICNSSASQEVKDAAGCNGSTADALPSVVVGILNAIIGAAGVVAVVFVIIGGFNYMTSSGDSAKVAKAKNTILYAVIGLIVCVLAFAIVNFVISDILNQ